MNTLAEWVAPGVTTTRIVPLELGLLAVVFALALTWQAKAHALLARLEQRTRSLAERPAASLALVFVFAIALRVALLPVAPVPTPQVNDEFSYLLAADTFAHGRLANPTHPHWIHFESIHISHQPTYASMYPPGQGLILAAGQVAGHPWLGVLASIGVMCAAFTWMLRGWTTPLAAQLGGVLAAVRLGTYGYWANSYYGGAHAAIAGALVLGALPRIRREARARDAAALAVGVGLFLNSRPFEGAIVAGATALTLLVWMGRGQLPMAGLLRRGAAPAGALFLVILAATAYYNWRVFGGPLTLPYTVNRATYAVAPTFITQPLREVPRYNHEELRRFYAEWEPMSYRYLHTVWGFRHALFDRYRQIAGFYFGPALLLPILLYPAVLFSRRLLPVTLTSAALCGAMTLTVWLLPHYVAAVSWGSTCSSSRDSDACVRGKSPGGLSGALRWSRAWRVAC